MRTDLSHKIQVRDSSIQSQLKIVKIKSAPV